MRRTHHTTSTLTRLATLVLFAALGASGLQGQNGHVSITVHLTDSIGSFDPLTAFGSTIDGHVNGSTRLIFTRANVAAMKSANFHPISYRLRTELGIEAWHWNPRGRWSDAAHKQGYWTSDDATGPMIRVSHGYRLPRRGNTIDQANDDGYSRLTDGDTTSFWKSNPYLDTKYTRDTVDTHPQWIVVDMDSAVDVSAIRIRWGVPFATKYDIQYWPDIPGDEPQGPDDNAANAGWRNFDAGTVDGGEFGAGGNALIPLSAQPVHTRWLRILMRSSSHTAARGSKDARDAAGFAIRELSIGRMVNGSFHDISRHAPNARDQTRTFASSTDPWHRSTDRDDGTEQPGIDLMFSSGLTRGLPMLTPVGVLYDTPANAAALLRYIRQRHYSVPRIELGEEPDGQFVTPSDFAALYIQVADSLHAVDPSVIVGGPSLQDGQTKVMMSWKTGETDERSWMGHFIDALAARGRMRDLGFVSFEFYPFDKACTATAPQLAKVPRKIRDAITQFQSDGVPADVPLLMTEYGYSPFSTQSEMDRSGAILNTIAVAEFMTHGGSETFYYGTEPSNLDRNESCDSWGDNTLFIADDERHIRARNSTYQSARMLTTIWADSSGGNHSILSTTLNVATDQAIPVSAYSIRRPDGRIAVLIVSRDPTHNWTVDLHGAGLASGSTLDVWRLSAAEYEWHANGEKGYAKPNTGPRKMAVAGGAPLMLPPYSILVVRER